MKYFDLLFRPEGSGGFVFKLRKGNFDQDEAEEVLKATKEVVERIKESNANNEEVASLCELMYYLGVQEDYIGGKEIQDFDYNITEILNELWPE